MPVTPPIITTLAVPEQVASEGHENVEPAAEDETSARRRAITERTTSWRYPIRGTATDEPALPAAGLPPASARQEDSESEDAMPPVPVPAPPQRHPPTRKPSPPRRPTQTPRSAAALPTPPPCMTSHSPPGRPPIPMIPAALLGSQPSAATGSSSKSIPQAPHPQPLRLDRYCCCNWVTSQGRICDQHIQGYDFADHDIVGPDNAQLRCR
ncbi:hypothetical protein J3R82DRAFT_318 [Butyriboletus roseoflavus]|nr:hypothetical protein J3R82DRAFT_318 [Butyriboletus roseoflavus]